MLLLLLRRESQLNLRPESPALAKVALGIKRQAPNHLLVSFQLALDLIHQRVHVG